MANAMLLIQPYRDRGVWMFDDGHHGLLREPFVLGMSEILDAFVEDLPGAETGFNLLFSSKPFPGASTHLRLVRPEMGGHWYRWEEKQLDGWLCPALFVYFDRAPLTIYVKAEMPTS